MATEGKFTGSETKAALEDIYKKYPQISPRSISCFTPIYYPIAIIEMQLDEVSFEDFETVQLTILKMVGLGIIDNKIIAQTLGLSASYVLKMLHLLVGCGHIAKNQITQLGQESLQAEQKITKTKVWQKFQVDALNGTLLQVEQTVADEMLSDRSQTSFWVGHLDCLEGVSAQTIAAQVEGGNYNRFVQRKNGVLNTNATKIHNIRCTEIKYAKACLMKLHDSALPIVLSKRFDYAQKTTREKFSWQPFGVPDQAFALRYGMSTETPICTQEAKQYITQVYQLIEQSQAGIQNINQVAHEVLQRFCPFNASGLHKENFEGNKAIATLQASAFDGIAYQPWLVGMLLDLLLGLAMHGEYLLTNERLFGAMISLRTSDTVILQAAQLLAQKVQEHGRGAITKRLKDTCNNQSEKNLLSTVVQELTKM